MFQTWPSIEIIVGLKIDDNNRFISIIIWLISLIHSTKFENKKMAILEIQDRDRFLLNQDKNL